MNLPLGLVTALESGNCVLFVGSGVGHNAKTPAGTASPDGAALASKLVDRYAIEADGSPDLAKVSQVVEIRKGRADLLAFLQKELTGLQPDMDLRWLTTLTWKAIFTTNYDDLIETCYSLDPSPTQQPVVIATNSEVKSFDARFEVPIYHLHGSLFTDGGRGAVLITEQDYAPSGNGVTRYLMYSVTSTQQPRFSTSGIATTTLSGGWLRRNCALNSVRVRCRRLSGLPQRLPCWIGKFCLVRASRPSTET